MDLSSETLLALDLVTARLKLRLIEHLGGYNKDFQDGYKYAIEDLIDDIEGL